MANSIEQGMQPDAEVWRYGATRAALRVDAGGIARLTVGGTLTAAVAGTLREYIVERIPALAARALLIDLRQCVVMMGEDCFPIARSTAGIAALPVALLVNADIEPLCLGYAWERAHAGYLMAVFTAPAEALEWAQSRAEGTSAWAPLGPPAS